MPLSEPLEGELIRGRLVGRRTTRVEDFRFMSGEARYLADLKLPRMLHARFLRSPLAHARISAIDPAPALAMPGVRAVFTGADLAGVPPFVDTSARPALGKTPQFPLAIGKVRFVGEAIALVVADDAYQTEDAADAIDVEFEPLTPVPDVETGMRESSALLFDDLGSNVVYRGGEQIGDAEAILASAPRVFEAEYRTNRYMALPIEPRGCLADYRSASAELTVWSTTQNPHRLKLLIADTLGLGEQHVRVIAPDVGGAFGQKISPYPEELAVPYAAMRLGRPVRWIEDRRENMLAATQAKQQAIRIRAAVDAEGRLQALSARCVGDIGAYSIIASGGALVEPQAAAKLMPGAYKLENYSYEVVSVLTNKAPIGAYRGIGWTAGHLARELLLDDIAREMGLDPLEVRLRNLITPADMPYRSCTGQLFDSGSFVESVRKVAESLDYACLRAEQTQLRDEGRYLGVGITPWVEPTGYGSRIGAEIGLSNTSSHDTARVWMSPTGKVSVATGLTSHGQGHETTFAQVAADALGVRLEDVAVLHGDTAVTPFGMGTAASRGAVIGAGTISRAAASLRAKLLALAGVLLEVDTADLVLADGAATVIGSPESRISVGELAHAAHFGNVRLPSGEDTALVASAYYDPLGTYSNGCAGAVVEVDPNTGLVTIRRLVVADDCGTVLNPLIVEGQIAGAVAQGIGGALLESVVYDGDAQPITANLMDYLIPTATDVPSIEVIHVETPSPHTVGGVKGMGESGMIATPATVVSAVLDALAPFGVRLHRLPLSPDVILEMIEAGSPRARLDPIRAHR